MKRLDKVVMFVCERFGGTELTPAQAFILAKLGLFVRCAGYYWRYSGKYGQYLAYGNYPESIRCCEKYTMGSFKETAGRCGTPWIIPRAKDLRI